MQWVPGALIPGVKRPLREADHSPTTNAEVKKMWIYTSTPPYAFMVYCLISSAQRQFYLFFYHHNHHYYCCFLVAIYMCAEFYVQIWTFETLLD
jgi:hypothetical protein